MSSIHDLRTFIAALEAAGQLARIQQPVSLEYELADVAATLARSGGGAALFEQVSGSPWPVFAGGVANQQRAAIALGCKPNEVTDVMARVLDPAVGIPPTPVSAAPWQTHVLTGDAIDLHTLPIPRILAAMAAPSLPAVWSSAKTPFPAAETFRTTACCVWAPALLASMSMNGGMYASSWTVVRILPPPSPSPLPSVWTRQS